MRIISKVLAYLFHPVFLPAMVMAFLLFVSGNAAFDVAPGNEMKWWIIASYSSVLFPLLVTFLIWRLKFIDSMDMKTNKERYVPLIASMLFYFWVFWVFYKDLQANDWLLVFLLGNFVTVVICFLINITEKLSLHTAAFANLFTYALLLNISTGFQDLVLLAVAIVLIIIIPASRLALHAHSKREIFLGAFTGVLSAIIAYLFI
jgi:membrane-associated phospholipid phosphatase